MTILRTCSFSSGGSSAARGQVLGTAVICSSETSGSETHLKSAMIPHAGSRRTPKRAAGSARDNDGVLEAWVDNFLKPGNLAGGFAYYQAAHVGRVAIMREQPPVLPPIVLRPACAGRSTMSCSRMPGRTG